jgi:hypothetical protein
MLQQEFAALAAEGEQGFVHGLSASLADLCVSGPARD